MKIFKKIMQVCLRKIIKLFDYFSPRKYMKLYNWYLNHIGRYESFWLKDITIKDNVFIGANSTILPGTIIEENCIIGAGTVIKGKIPKNSVVIGNPSRIVSNTLEWAEKKQMEKEYIYEKKEFN